MKNKLRVIAVIELLCGIIGCIYIPIKCGVNTFTGERDMIFSLVLFLVILCTGIFNYIIIFSFSEMLDNQECIYQRVDELFKKSEQEIKDNHFEGWTCPKCGKKNANYVGSCSCGANKPL